MNDGLVMGACAAGLFLLVVALSGIRVAQEYQRSVVFRLGRYHGLRGPGRAGITAGRVAGRG